MTYHSHSRKNYMKLKLILPIIALTLSANLFAQSADGMDSVSNFLIISTEQQQISLGRYLDANRDIANQCMPGWSLDKSNSYFLDWVDDHPQYLRRGLTTAFSHALMDACKIK